MTAELPKYWNNVSVGRKPPFRARQKSPIMVNLKNQLILKAILSERMRSTSYMAAKDTASDESSLTAM